jgi:hypothetical protein
MAPDMNGPVAPPNAAPPEERTRLLRPTMSRASLVLTCQWPWGKRAPVDIASPEANYGNAYHLVLAKTLAHISLKIPPIATVKKIATRFNVDGPELYDHVRRSFPVLKDWLQKDNPWRVDLLQCRRRPELPLAYDVARGTARVIRPPTDSDHQYEDAEPYEFAGTGDLFLDAMPDHHRAKKAPHFITLDHKTGENCDLPQDSAQLKSLSNAYDSIVTYDRVIGGAIFHANKNGAATVYAHEFDKEELEANKRALKQAFRRIGDGSLVPGPHCGMCPGLSICPAWTSALVKVGTVDITGMSAEKLGEQHQTVGVIRKYIDQWGANAKAWVRANGPGVRPDGKALVIKEREVERVSKKNVVEAVGAVEAEKVFVEWRKKGFLITDTEERLEAVNDD